MNRTTRCIRVIWATALALTPCALPVDAAGQALEVTNGRVVVVCPLTIGGRFEAKTSAVTGQITLADDGRTIGGTFAVDLATLDTGIQLRTSHLRENYLEVYRGEDYATAVLSDVVLDAPLSASAPGPRGFQGRLKVHGQTRPVTGAVDIARKGDRLDVQVRFPLSIDAYQIARPAYLGVGVANRIEVNVKATLQPWRPATR